MAQVLTPALSLNIPTSSRQDVVSALLNDYGTSFGQNDPISHDFSPAPALKELPPPPPSNSERPLPPTLLTRFPLREESNSPDGSVTSPTQIASRSISRNSKPRSLKLTKSNGSTAVVASSPAPGVPAKAPPIAPGSQLYEERPLPRPPQKSELRSVGAQTGRPDAMGHQSSKIDRKEAKESQEVAASVQVTELKSDSSPTVDPTQTAKRKPLPIATITRKIASFTDLKKGLRGRAASTTSSADSDKTVTQNHHSRESSRTFTLSLRTRKNSHSSQLPPTPDEDPVTDTSSPLPPLPQKIYAGLPSNPRPPQKNVQQPSLAGQGNGAFGVTQSFKSPNTIQTITPERTPSPRKPGAVVTELARTISPPDQAVPVVPQQPQSPGSPVHNDDPFLRWGTPKPEPEAPVQDAPSANTVENTTAPPPVPQAQFPPRTSSKPAPQPPKEDHSPMPAPSHQVTEEYREANDKRRASVVAQEHSGLPPRIADKRPITDGQLQCYTGHATLAQYFSRRQTPPCMVCGTTEGNKRCTCSWCILQICIDCRNELLSIPGRKLQVLLDKKNQQ